MIKNYCFLSFLIKKTLNCIENLFILASVVAGYVSISVVISLVSFFSIMNSTTGLKIYAMIAGIKKYKSIIKKKKKKHGKIVLLAKTKLNSMKILISRASID